MPVSSVFTHKGYFYVRVEDAHPTLLSELREQCEWEGAKAGRTGYGGARHARGAGGAAVSAAAPERRLYAFRTVQQQRFVQIPAGFLWSRVFSKTAPPLSPYDAVLRKGSDSRAALDPTTAPTVHRDGDLEQIAPRTTSPEPLRLRDDVFALRPYQEEARVQVYAFWDACRRLRPRLPGVPATGILDMEPGLGKTKTCVGIVVPLQQRVLHVCPTEHIFTATVDAYRETSTARVGLLRGKTWQVDPDAYDVVVAMMPTLRRAIQVDGLASVRARLCGHRFGIFVSDESHRMAALRTAPVLQVSRAPLQLHLTATPDRDDRLPTGPLLGPVVFRATSERPCYVSFVRQQRLEPWPAGVSAATTATTATDTAPEPSNGTPWFLQDDGADREADNAAGGDRNTHEDAPAAAQGTLASYFARSDGTAPPPPPSPVDPGAVPLRYMFRAGGRQVDFAGVHNAVAASGADLFATVAYWVRRALAEGRTIGIFTPLAFAYVLPMVRALCAELADSAFLCGLARHTYLLEGAELPPPPKRRRADKGAAAAIPAAPVIASTFADLDVAALATLRRVVDDAPALVWDRDVLVFKSGGAGAKRERRLRELRLRSARVLVGTVDMFKEGFDMPPLDMAIHFVCRKGIGLNTQVIGRSQRPWETKQFPWQLYLAVETTPDAVLWKIGDRVRAVASKKVNWGHAVHTFRDPSTAAAGWEAMTAKRDAFIAQLKQRIDVAGYVQRGEFAKVKTEKLTRCHAGASA